MSSYDYSRVALYGIRRAAPRGADAVRNGVSMERIWLTSDRT